MEITLGNYNRQAISYICMWAIGYFLWILWNNAVIIFGKNCIVFIAPYTVLVICNILWTIGVKFWSLNKKSSVCILITGICNIFDRGSILPNAYSYQFTMLVPSMSVMIKAGICCMKLQDYMPDMGDVKVVPYKIVFVTIPNMAISIWLNIFPWSLRFKGKCFYCCNLNLDKEITKIPYDMNAAVSYYIFDDRFTSQKYTLALL